MPKRNRQNATTRIRTAWTKRDRSRFMAGSLEREHEGHDVHVLLGRQHLTERLGHHARWEAGYSAHALGVEDLFYDVVRRLDLGDLREVGPHRRGADLAGLVAGDASGLGLEQRFARLRVAWQLDLRRRSAGGGRAHGGRDVVESPVEGPAQRFEEGSD